jgi:hypothetical protein
MLAHRKKGIVIYGTTAPTSLGTHMKLILDTHRFPFELLIPSLLLCTTRFHHLLIPL